MAIFDRFSSFLSHNRSSTTPSPDSQATQLNSLADIQQDGPLFGLASRNPGAHGPLTPSEANGSTSGGSRTSGGGEIGSQTFVSSGSNLELVVNFDASTANAPQAFDNAVAVVAQDFVNQFTTPTPVTVTIDVGYGEVGGSKVSAGALGESEADYQTVPGSTAAAQYQTLQAAYANNPLGPLPASDPVTGNQQWWVTSAEGKALGLFPNSDSVDGYVGFSSANGIWGWDPNSISSSQYDFESVVAHEFSEVMGRATLNGDRYPGSKLPEYMPLDLFHFSDASPGTRSYSGTVAGYFSWGDDLTEYKQFSTNRQGDFSDWQPVAGSSDAFDASGGLGTASPVSEADYNVMQAVGWLGTGWKGPWG